MPDEQNVTVLLGRARQGEAEAFNTLIAIIYDELRAIARSQRRRLGAANTINTTAVVHEAYAKLASSNQQTETLAFIDRGHFFRIAALVMRDVIVDYAKAQSAQKRGGGIKPVSLDDLSLAQMPRREVDPAQMLSVHAALMDLEALHEEAAQVARLRYYAGLTTEQIAEALGLSPMTVKRRWTVARAWLYRRLSEA